ncbi:adenosylcobinamide-GDP ribazoletransferase [Thalassospira profundimaris]|nr:adenosylcobinamide-GDP ribazoletransferase [Thalassospira profundimaris]
MSSDQPFSSRPHSDQIDPAGTVQDADASDARKAPESVEDARAADLTNMERLVADFGRALMLLSRIPWPARLEFQSGLIARSVWCWPLVGILLAGMAVLPAQAVLGLTGNTGLAAVFALMALVGLTGALHEDGLADCADGFGGGVTRERKLAIMRDSRIGSYGVVALVIAFAARFFVLQQAIESGVFMMLLLVVALFSRLSMPVIMLFLSPAREDGLGRGAGRPAVVPFLVAALLCILLTLLLAGPVMMLASVLAMVLACFVVGLLARWQIGGHSGDVLGCCQIVTEIFVAIALLSVLHGGLA